ncbi:serine/threonine-protein kinase [Geodermatophilus sp. DSM 44513]|uniref:serine/threonine-protein kinase n=1 Tax=Geodermatophilus sp. DSM 44513 TaxID=1528104 RepID=UPI001270C8A2|nr:serine/threonine-protein kinase [Geodermatophilus sp. DSM 44513]WNV74095.1 serine/threonine-protein kinase [Geodermatophilus sp. DSM 44513]
MDEALDPAGAVADLAGTREIRLLEPGDPDRIGPYHLICRLPRGGQGADVFVGSAGEDGALVVIKRLPEAAPDLARRRLAREVENAARVTSPRVASIVDRDLTADAPYYVQQYVPGTPLDEFMAARAGGLTGGELRRIALGLLAALRDVHAAGVVHRDVKPGNIIICGDQVWLVDFGISRYVGPEPPSGTVTSGMAALGTKLFASPEQLAGAVLSEASDVYSWGLVVAFAAGGVHPVDPDDSLPDSDYYLALRAGRLDLSRVPGDLLDSVQQALRFLPERRPTVDRLARQVEQRTRRLVTDPADGDPRRPTRDLPSLGTVTDTARQGLARVERAVADTWSGFAAAAAVVVLLGLVIGLVLAVAFHAVF